MDLKNKCLVSLILLCLISLALAVPLASAGTFPFAYEQQTLSNGLKVIVVPLDTPGLITYFSIVRTGSRDEVEPGRSGYAHFFEHMMFRGTKNLPGPEYDRIVTGLGANSNAFTTDDFTAYHLTIPQKDLETVVKIESDRFQNLSYEKQAFQTEAGAVYGEYRKSVSSPFMILEEKLLDAAFDKHTYKHTTMGFEADVKAMPEGYDYSLSFFKRFYRPENVVILITGDVRPKAALTLIEKYYGDWKPGYQPPKIAPEPPQQAPRSGEIAYSGRTLPILCIAYKGAAFDPGDKDYAAARLLSELAFGETSELHKKLVLRDQAVEFLAADVPMNRDMPLFTIATMVKAEKDIAAVREEIYKTIERFQSTPVDAQKLADVKKRMKYGFLMGLDSSDNVAEALARIVAVAGGIEAIDKSYDTLETVTPGDIRRAAEKFYRPDRRTVMVLKGEK
jgi:zinc protease